MKKKFRSFKEARTFIRSLQLKNVNAWDKFIKSDDRPNDIPAAPRRTYKKEWKGWGDFLGTGRTANQNLIFKSFKEARKFTRSLKLKSGREWQEYCKSGKKPDDIPYDPSGVYKNKGWANWIDFLGSDPRRAKNRKFWPFKKAREFIQSLKLKSGKEWREYYKSDNRPIELPASPQRAYKKEWIGMGDWLGTGNVATRNLEFRPFKEAKKFARSLKLKSGMGWKQYCKSGEKPDDIPYNPGGAYKNKGWISVADWLGSGYKKGGWRSFVEARKFARSLKRKSDEEWRKYCKSGKKPDDIPNNPRTVYKKEFQGMGDWLGTGNVATKEFWSFKKARAYVRKLGLKNFEEWVVFRKSRRRPDYIPGVPQNVYKEEFVSVGDWLGTGSIGGLVKTRNYLPFKEAQKIYKKLAKQYHLIGRADWNRFASTHKKLLDNLRLPADPSKAYSKQAVIKYGKVRRERRK